MTFAPISIGKQVFGRIHEQVGDDVRFLYDPSWTCPKIPCHETWSLAFKIADGGRFTGVRAATAWLVSLTD